MKKKHITPLVLMAVCIAFVAGTVAFTPIAITGVGDGLGFKGGSYCVCKNSEECHAGVADAYCKNNVLTEAGKNATRLYLNTDGTYQAFDVLVLSNVTPDIAQSWNFTQEMVGGLARAAGTVTDYHSNGNGNWSVYHTFTADGQFLSVNTTGIYNDTTAGAGAMLCGGTFTSVNLENSDTLSINYTLWIS